MENGKWMGASTFPTDSLDVTRYLLAVFLCDTQLSYNNPSMETPFMDLPSNNPFSTFNHPSFSHAYPSRLTIPSLSSPNYPTTSPLRFCADTTPPPILQDTDALLDSVPERTQNRRRVVRLAWEKLVRWSRSLRFKAKTDVLERTNKVAVLGGGSFGTAMAAHIAGRKPQLEVNMLLRDLLVCQSINDGHYNSKYFPKHKLPINVIATTDAKAALLGADFCFHAVPVQFSSSFLESIAHHVDPHLPFISLSKGLELNSLRMMSQIVPQALSNPRQPFVALSGPSFASELMNKLPTAMVVASKDKKLANAAQQLLASSYLRISTSSDVTGVEIAGALKNVLAIAAGIVEGMNLGNNSMAALVAQGCSEIRWLATKMGAKPTTITGLSGTGDIMLTCFVNLSRNRTVGVRLGSGENLDDILSSMNQVAEGVSTAGAVIALAQKYKVKMPVLTAVARIIDNELTPQKAVLELMGLPQVEEV
ncbi:glycerol-3-phosphate dehydrogenase [NAD(+)] 2, chloroplastic isoform X1 [Cucumis sativus]|uniref:Glycerol-3-phosphate dehydrogenase [NAD(+)] n=1 Tax=Cucumis sativus TaxID=3659 RepID=A0A0A0KPB1_CUCSA|nr:glycerol-3-phosphate dehydrogenase [NAD(+)] 2, chloroplastic isoform X1 [Cucumis sativus]